MVGWSLYAYDKCTSQWFTWLSLCTHASATNRHSSL